MKTPCIKVCQMDPRLGLCLGCKRTLDEIARWGGMTDAEQEEILNELKNRSDVLEVPVPPLA